MARLKIIFGISTLVFHLGVEFDSTLTIVNNEKNQFIFQTDYSRYTKHIDK